MSHEHEKDDVLVLDDEKQDEKIEPPRPFAVVVLNDDYTTMDFVTMVLVELFQKSQDEAERIMMDVHQQGEGLAGVYPKDIAETKAAEVCSLAQQAEYPLKAVARPLH